MAVLFVALGVCLILLVLTLPLPVEIRVYARVLPPRAYIGIKLFGVPIATVKIAPLGGALAAFVRGRRIGGGIGRGSAARALAALRSLMRARVLKKFSFSVVTDGDAAWTALAAGGAAVLGSALSGWLRVYSGEGAPKAAAGLGLRVSALDISAAALAAKRAAREGPHEEGK